MHAAPSHVCVWLCVCACACIWMCVLSPLSFFWNVGLPICTPIGASRCVHRIIMPAMGLARIACICFVSIFCHKKMNE